MMRQKNGVVKKDPLWLFDSRKVSQVNDEDEIDGSVRPQNRPSSLPSLKPLCEQTSLDSLK